MVEYSLTPIGIANNGHKEKFGTPRQSLLTSSIETVITLYPPFNDPSAIIGLEGFSHLWIQFLFHEHYPYNWSPTVRPPRLGGNKKMGVFATRSPFRPNLLGLSLVKLEKILGDKIFISGADFIDNTPILDIKPYLKSTEAISEATEGWTSELPLKHSKKISFSDTAQLVIKEKISLERELLELLTLPTNVAYKPLNQEFGFTLHGLNIRCKESEDEVLVLDITSLKDH